MPSPPRKLPAFCVTLAPHLALGPGRSLTSVARCISHARPGVVSRRVTMLVTPPADSGAASSASYLSSLGSGGSSKVPETAASFSSAVAGGDISGRGGGGGGGSGGGGDRRDDGPGRGDSGGEGAFPAGDGLGDESTLRTMLAERRLRLTDLPLDIVNAYQTGLVGASVLVNYLHAQSNWLSRLLMRAGSGMRNRFLADRLFLLKIAIEEGMGIAGKLGAEYERRRDNFFNEGEFVFANLVTALLADFALVYLPAPSVALTRSSARTGWLSRISTDLPSNIFQTDRAFTIGQRVGSFALKGVQLVAVGFICCAVGAAVTNGLVFIRERVDKSYKPKTEKTNVLAVSALYATFLGVSSGSRYQLVNGIESHVFPRLFAKSPGLVEQAATLLLRYGNTFWGSQQWVIFCRLTNVQKSKAALE